MRAVLTYHSIDDSGSAVSVDPAVFEQHVRWLASGSVRVVPLGEILSVPADEDAVAVTFDDALESFARAAPRLIEAGIPVTVFVVSDRAGGTNRWGHPSDGAVPELRLLGWEELRRLADRGVELGAHTRTHPDLTRLNAAAREEELDGCIRRIEEETGQRPRSFAYPFGFHDHDTVEAARERFDVACTAELRLLERDTDPLRIPRLDMFYFRRPGLLEAWGAAGFHRYLWVRRAGRRVRSLARPGGWQ